MGVAFLLISKACTKMQRKEKLFPFFWALCVQSKIEVDFKKNNNQQLKIWNEKSYEKNYSEIC